MAEGVPADQAAHRGQRGLRHARVTANGRPVKASYDVKAGDILELKFGERTVKVEVLVVADNVGKADAAAMYREVL